MDDLYIGLISGTSVDAVDAVLVDFKQGKPRLLHTHAEPFPKQILAQLQTLIASQTTSLSDLAELDHALAVLYTLAVKKLLLHAAVSAKHVTAIGSHGQTIYHQPDGEHTNSIQIGDPNFLAEHTRIDVVADFRRHDMAAGGQGAPLVPAFHAHVFRDPIINRAILNLGGIANITVLPADVKQPVTGFDTGPANTLLDLWINRHLQRRYDKNGNWARHGKSDDVLLGQMLQDPYFAKTPPKSTGREHFNLTWLENFNAHDLEPQDVQATLCTLTVHSIANAINAHAANTTEIFVCGGGVHNETIMTGLQQALPNMRVASTEVLGLLPDWIEATAFAWLAQQTLHHQPGNICSVTGAKRAVPLGGVYLSG